MESIASKNKLTRTLYLTVKSGTPTKVVFEKPVPIGKIKINKAVLTLNYKNLTENAHVKTSSNRVDFTPGFWTFKELKKSFDKLGIGLSIEEHTQKAIIKAPAGSAISLSDNLRDLLGSDTKTFQAASLTTLAYPCNILNGLKYLTVRCDEINGSTNLRSDKNFRSVPTNTLGILGIKTFSFVGGTQYHDASDFTAKELIFKSYFNDLTFSLSGNNSKDVGEVFLELLLANLEHSERSSRRGKARFK